MPQATIYLPNDVAAELETMRSKRRPIPSMNALINDLVWDALPTNTQIKLRRERKVIKNPEDLGHD